MIVVKNYQEAKKSRQTGSSMDQFFREFVCQFRDECGFLFVHLYSTNMLTTFLGHARINLVLFDIHQLTNSRRSYVTRHPIFKVTDFSNYVS